MKRICKSPLFWALLLLISAPLLPLFCTFGILFLALILVPFDRLRPKSLFYAVTILRTIVLHYILPKKYPWCQEIIPDLLWLGAIPLANYNHDVLISKKVKAVVTIGEDHELQPGLFSDPVSGQRWAELGVRTLRIIAADFQPIDQAQINRAVQFIYEELQQGHGVYVHCKAGRGRSAMIVVCFLLAHGKEFGIEVHSVDDAVAYVKARRPAINMNQRQIGQISLCN